LIAARAASPARTIVLKSASLIPAAYTAPPHEHIYSYLTIYTTAVSSLSGYAPLTGKNPSVDLATRKPDALVV
jgi:hypothetical protein